MTELGRMMQPYLSEILGQSEAAKAQAQAAADLTGVTLTIGVMCSLGPQIFSGFLKAFHGRHSGIELHIVDATAARLADMLAKGKIEVAIYGHPEGFDETFHVLPLFDERFVVVVPEGHPFCDLETVQGRNLDGQPYVNRAHCEYNDHAGRVLTDLGINITACSAATAMIGSRE